MMLWIMEFRVNYLFPFTRSNCNYQTEIYAEHLYKPLTFSGVVNAVSGEKLTIGNCDIPNRVG